MNFANQTASETVEAIAKGACNCVDVVNHYSDIIAATDSKIDAWEHYNREFALQQAISLDQNSVMGPLHGIPVGLKDIVDTVDFPTEHGSPIHKGRQPDQDSAVTEKLKAAGAVIMGKTVTTEFAFFNPSQTRNPHDEKYSPGGSSSGSAAAVAAGQIPLAVGSQTGGSVIRPASFCGVYGFKPSRGLISRRGVLETSSTLDHVGVFARNLADIATLTDAISGYDAADNASFHESKQSLVDHLHANQNNPPVIAWFDMPYSDRYSKDAADAFESLLKNLVGAVIRKPAPAEFSSYLDAHKAIYDYEIIRALNDEITNHPASLSDAVKPIFEAAKNRTEAEYREALAIRESAIEWFANFHQQYDALLTPSAIGEAPLMGSTGDPICCTIFSLTGMPCINLPLLKGNSGLPIGVQLVGGLKQDHLLMSHAAQLIGHPSISTTI